MSGFNWTAFRWSVFIGIMAAAVIPLVALSTAEPDWRSVIVALIPAFVSGLGAGYAVLRDVMPIGTGVVAPKEYGWHTRSVIAVGTFALIVATVVGGLVGAFLAEGLISVMSRYPATSGVDDPELDAALAILRLLADADRAEAISRLGVEGIVFIQSAMAGIFFFLVCPFVGRWIGYKSMVGNSFVMVVWTILVHRVVMILLDLSVLGYEQYLQTLSDIGTTFQSTLIAIPIALALGLAGCWFGRRVRGSNYLHYLLTSLPEDTREELLDLAHAEADRLRA